MTNVSNSSLLNYSAGSVEAKSDMLSRNAIKAVKNDVLEPVQSVEKLNAATKLQQKQPEPAELQEAVDVINRAMTIEQRSLSFSIDDTSGRSIIKVTDIETEQLIRQIPSEEVLKVAQDIKRLQDEMGQSLGLLVNRQV